MKSINRNVRGLLLGAYSLISKKRFIPSNEEIDIVIPIIKKDLGILPLCLEGVKHNVTNKIKNIYIVAPNDPEIIQFCEKEHLMLVDESTVLGISPSDINLLVSTADGSKIDRSGWLFQQLIKLSGNIGTCENYLCIDSDHILVRPHTFLASDGYPVFYMSSEMHIPYYRNIKSLVDIKSLHAFSFVAHKMIFNKKQINLLHEAIENRNKKDWISAIIESYDRSQVSGFSEFELYGNFCTEKHICPWHQKILKYSKLGPYSTLVKKYSRRFFSITFPSYYN